jgi:hypothetical protein
MMQRRGADGSIKTGSFPSESLSTTIVSRFGLIHLHGVIVLRGGNIPVASPLDPAVHLQYIGGILVLNNQNVDQKISKIL